MMKKILWVCNTPLPEIQKFVGMKSYNEGWLIGISNHLREKDDIVFHYAFPQNIGKRTVHRIINGVNFWGFYNCRKNSYKIEKERIQNFSTIIKKIDPDIIHIFGTEYQHTLECIKSVEDKRKIVVSLQGLASEIAKVYVNGIPFKDRLVGRIEGNHYQCMLTEQYEFYRRGINEKKILLSVKNVIGRTDWDRRYVKKINSKCNYYHCNETLRDIFYVDSWDINRIKRYSIFVSQANYTIKGIHILITALPMIKKRFPDVMVYVAGHKEFLEDDIPYGRYIKKLLKQNHVEENVVFLGYHSDLKMKQRLLESHIMLMPSLVENSPNSVGEAMLLGTPVVAANVGGIASILQNGLEGYLYPCLDTKALAKAVCKIFKNDNLALEFSKKGKEKAKNLYDPSDNLKQLLKIYNEIGNK